MMIYNPYTIKSCIEYGVRFPESSIPMVEHYGQCGEDIIVSSLLEAYCFKKNIDFSGMRYCEIGGNHPISTSASFLLNKKYGLTGVIVEANPYLIKDLQKARPWDKIINLAVTDDDTKKLDFFIGIRNELSSIEAEFLTSWPGEGGGIKEQIVIDSIKIDQLLSEEFPEDPPIYLSIDIEGADFRILKSMTLDKIRPLIIQIEPSDHYISLNSNKIFEFLNNKEYQLVAKTNVNMIFIDRNSDAYTIKKNVL